MRQRIRRFIKPIRQFGRAAPLLYRNRRNKNLRRVFDAYIGFIPLNLFSAPLSWFIRLLRAPQRFERDDQRPHRFYMPALATAPFAPEDDVSKYLEENWDTIRSEYLALAPKTVQTPSKALVAEGAWNTFPLLRAAKIADDNVKRCPKTWSIVEKCPLPWGALGGVYFSILSPGTKIAPHFGPSNVKYRYHLTIQEADDAQIRSADEWRTWPEGKCLILDDSFEHEVAHNGQTARVVLIVDCWRPDLTEAEREFITQLHQCWA